MTKTKAKTKILYRYEWFKRRPIVFKIIIKMFFWFHLQTTIILLKHRVVLPNDEKETTAARQSLAFFVQPDDNVQ